MAQDVNIKINVDANQAEQSTVNYKKTLKDLQAQMVELQVNTNGLANATDEQRAQYAALEQQAGKLSDAISDVSARVKANADDYQYFNASLEALKGGTAVAQGLVGTLDLLGVSNTGVEKVVKTLMSLQGVMNSLNAVQQIFNKDSKIRIALEKIMTSQTKQKAVAEGASATALTAEGVATTGATVATRSFTAALMSNPIFLMATVIAGVTAALITFTGVLDDNSDSVDENSKSVEKNTEKWHSNMAARRAALEGLSGGLIDTIENKGLSVFEREAAMLEFVTSKLGVQVQSVEEARKVYDNFKKAVGDVTMEMDVFEADGTKVHRVLTTVEDAARSLVNAQANLKEIQEGAENLSADASSEDKMYYEQMLQKYESFVRYAQNMYDILERKTVGTYKKMLKSAEQTGKGAKEIAKQTTDEAGGYIVDLGEIQRHINDEVYKDEEKTYEGKRKHLLEEIDFTEQAFEQEKEDMKAILDEESQEYQDWLDLRETQVSQHLENVNEKIDELDKEENRKRLDRENQVDSEILQARLNNLKEGSEEYYDVQREIEDEQHQQYLEDLRRRLEDELITKEEFDLLYEEEKKKHIQRLQEIDDGEKQHKIAIFLEKLDAIAHYTEQAEKIVQASSNFVMALQDAELANAEGDEKKQKEIKKKYAVANMVMTIGQIAVETIMGSVAALANGIRDMGMPVGAIVGGITAALVTATGIAATVKAVREKNNIMKMAKGGLVVGASHSNGGVRNYELEGGEFVLSRKTMAIPEYRSLASAMNMSTGGNGISSTSGNSGVSIINKDDLRAIVQEIAAIPVVVSEQSITNAQRKVGVIEGRSRF